MQQLLDIFLHVDQHLEKLVNDFPTAVYAILFGIIFAETGLVVTPFLPGDSLLFAIGALAARGLFNVWMIAGLLIVAAVLGDAVNYHIGQWIGPKVFKHEDPGAATPGEAEKKRLLVRLLNKKHLDRAHAFFDKHGGKAVIMARFVPIVRTFIPFVAGAGAMNYGKFFLYNVTGGIAWVGICIAAGFWFGNFEVVKKNFELVIIGIIVVSLIPIGIEYIRARREAAAKKNAIAPATVAGK